MDRPVAYLTSVYARAGDTFIRREVEELRRRGWTVHTFSIRRADEGEAVSEEIRREQRTTHYVLEQGPLALTASLVRAALRAPRRMVAAIRQAASLRPPGLRAAALHAVYLVEAAHLAEELRARDVALLHDHISMNSATVAMLASTLSGIPFSMTVHGPHDFLEAERWALGRKVAASALTVCISEFGRSQCMLFTPPEHWHKLRVVRCGLEREVLEAPAAPVPATPRVVAVGRLSPEKGHLVLVRAAARLLAEGMDLEVVIVGDGPSRGDLEREARALGAEGRVRLVGWAGSAEVRRWLEESRAVVQPSFAEGIPVVLMEAMAARRPVIATFVGGVPELVRPGESGWLVPAGSVDALADALRAALRAEPAELERMGARGREAVLARHDLERETGTLAALLADASGLPDPVLASPRGHAALSADARPPGAGAAG